MTTINFNRELKYTPSERRRALYVLNKENIDQYTAVNYLWAVSVAKDMLDIIVESEEECKKEHCKYE